METANPNTPADVDLANACLRGDSAAMHACIKAGAGNFKVANESACEHGGAIAVELARHVLGHLKSLGDAAKGYCRRYWLDFNSHGLIGLCRRGNLADVTHALSRKIDGRKLTIYAECLYDAAYRGHADVVQALAADKRCTDDHKRCGVSGALAGSFAGVHKDHVAIIVILKQQ